MCEDLLALGIAKGKLILFKIDLIIELLGNLIATVSKFDVAKLDNLFFLIFYTNLPQLPSSSLFCLN